MQYTLRSAAITALLPLTLAALGGCGGDTEEAEGESADVEAAEDQSADSGINAILYYPGQTRGNRARELPGAFRNHRG